jgi:hypothetical protein
MAVAAALSNTAFYPLKSGQTGCSSSRGMGAEPVKLTWPGRPAGVITTHCAACSCHLNLPSRPYSSTIVGNGARCRSISHVYDNCTRSGFSKRGFHRVLVVLPATSICCWGLPRWLPRNAGYLLLGLSLHRPWKALRATLYRVIPDRGPVLCCPRLPLPDGLRALLPSPFCCQVVLQSLCCHCFRISCQWFALRTLFQVF